VPFERRFLSRAGLRVCGSAAIIENECSNAASHSTHGEMIKGLAIDRDLGMRL
jgi:hypothetical protein